MNYAFGIVRASQLTMADATQGFLQQILEKASFATRFSFPYKSPTRFKEDF